MAAYNKYQVFVGDLGKGFHNLIAAGHVLKVMLSNTTPNAATHVVFADAVDFAGGTGYTAGGTDVQNDYSQTSGTASLTGVDVVWTAGASDWNPFRYVVLYNATQTTPVKPLIAWWDYASPLTLSSGETFTVDFGSSIFTLA